MSSDVRTRLEAELAKAQDALAATREENTKLAEAFRADPTDASREHLRRAASSLAIARDRLDAAKAALATYEKTGGEHGLVASAGKVIGSIAIAIPPGTSRPERERLIDSALGEQLARAASELGATLGASPERYVRERPGRDEEERTILDVAGRVEGDVLLPAISRAAKSAR